MLEFRASAAAARWARSPDRAPSQAAPAPPPQVAHLLAAVGPAHAQSNARAIRAGRRYRGAFWSLYLLSALAVLCAVMPLALGWDARGHAPHPWAAFWAVLEVVVIAVLGLTYLHGQRHDWQGQLLASRTDAELAWYLPLLAPLVVPAAPDAPVNWYARLAAGAMHAPPGAAVDALCAQLEPPAHAALLHAWSDPAFVQAYVTWAVSQFEAQRSYHERVAQRSEALMRRMHKINGCLFALTLAAALAHLALHCVWLSLATIFFPALAAALHGALAQSESYRLAAASWRLAAGLAGAVSSIGALQAAGEPAALRAAIEAALTLILDEHRDWHMLVRPHHLPLG